MPAEDSLNVVPGPRHSAGPVGSPRLHRDRNLSADGDQEGAKVPERTDRWWAYVCSVLAKEVPDNNYLIHLAYMACGTCAATHCEVKACLPSLQAATEAASKADCRTARKMPHLALPHCHTLDISSKNPRSWFALASFAHAMPHHYSVKPLAWLVGPAQGWAPTVNFRTEWRQCAGRCAHSDDRRSSVPMRCARRLIVPA